MSSAICFESIRDFKPSNRTLDGIEEIERLANMGTILGSLIVTIPFFSIFVGKDTYAWASMVNQGWQLSQTDWVAFSGALSGANEITRLKIYTVANQQWFLANGDDAVFWKCVANASK